MQCYDMRAGNLLHLPYGGGVWDQDEHLMTAINIARWMWIIKKYKPENDIELTMEDAEFLAWADGDN